MCHWYTKERTIVRQLMIQYLSIRICRGYVWFLLTKIWWDLVPSLWSSFRESSNSQCTLSRTENNTSSLRTITRILWWGSSYNLPWSHLSLTHQMYKCKWNMSSKTRYLNTRCSSSSSREKDLNISNLLKIYRLTLIGRKEISKDQLVLKNWRIFNL